MLIFFFFNDTATTEIYTLSLHDALPICQRVEPLGVLRPSLVALDQPPEPGEPAVRPLHDVPRPPQPAAVDRKSTRLNSSHANISYAVFCLKKKTKIS